MSPLSSKLSVGHLTAAESLLTYSLRDASVARSMDGLRLSLLGTRESVSGN